MEYARRPDDWTPEAAAEQMQVVEQFCSHLMGKTRPLAMHAIAMEAQVATMEVLGRIASGSKAKKRKGELSKVAGNLSVRWSQQATLPVLVRSVEHKIALVGAAWAIKVLRDALDGWDV